MKTMFTLAIAFFTTVSFAQVEGTWKLANQAGALGVGPTLGDISWWSNSAGDLTTRACLFDDSISFDANGNMTHYMDGNTWLEVWQGVTAESCGTPVAPHNGMPSTPYTYNHDASAGTLSVYGLGAHIGLAKVYNGGELTTPSNAVDTITYDIAFSNNNNTMTADISIGGGYWRFIYERTVPLAPPTNAMVTFSVDMNQYTGTINDGVNLSGSFNGWCGDCAYMDDSNGDGIYEITVTIPPGPIEYKFSVDDWADSEQLTDGTPCVDTVSDGFVNRFYEVTGDATVPTVCWASCDICKHMVTFSVDMNQYSGTITDGVNLSGSFNGWCGDCAYMDDSDGDGVYEITVEIGPGPIEYKFSRDNWADSEQLTDGTPCVDTVSDGFVNRFYDVTGDATIPTVCWASCEGCPQSINEINNLALTLSPNPVNNSFILNFEGTPSTITIVDMSGRIVNTIEAYNAGTQVDASQLSSGIYTVIMYNNEGSGKTLFVKE